MNYINEIVDMVIGICMFISICFIVYYNMKCHHHWEVIETFKGETNGWPYIIKVMQCTECGKIKKVKIL